MLTVLALEELSDVSFADRESVKLWGPESTQLVPAGEIVDALAALPKPVRCFVRQQGTEPEIVCAIVPVVGDKRVEAQRRLATRSFGQFLLERFTDQRFERILLFQTPRAKCQVSPAELDKWQTDYELEYAYRLGLEEPETALPQAAKGIVRLLPGMAGMQLRPGSQ